MMRVVHVRFLAGRYADEIHAGALEPHAARELRAMHVGLRIPGMGELLCVCGDVRGAHDVEAGFVHAATLTAFTADGRHAPGTCRRSVQAGGVSALAAAWRPINHNTPPT